MKTQISMLACLFSLSMEIMMTQLEWYDTVLLPSNMDIFFVPSKLCIFTEIMCMMGCQLSLKQLCFLLLVVGQSLSHRYSFGLQSCKLFWKDGPWWLWRWPNSSLSCTHKKSALLQLQGMTYV